MKSCLRASRACLLLALLPGAGRLAAQVTEVPQTIRPGHFLVRMDAITVGFDRETTTPRRYTALGLANTVLSIGLTSTIDLQAGFQLYARETYQTGTGRASDSGIGDMAFRVKWMFWQDPAAGAAAAVIPYVRIPSNKTNVGTDKTEGGLIVPWAMDVGAGFRTGAMFQWDLLRNDARSGYDSHWSGSAYFQRNVARIVGLYGETTVAVSSATKSSFAGTLGGGVTLNASRYVQWDYGISRGVGTRSTDWIHQLRLRWEF